MNSTTKFIITVASLLIVSALILTACMRVVSEETDAPKTYDMDIVSETGFEQGGSIIDNSPTSQNEMQKKFSDMSAISESGKSITVISEEYLNKYWEARKNKSVALTAAEVNYIVQDSIRIYFEYEEFVLVGNPELESMHVALQSSYTLFDATFRFSTISKSALGANYAQALHDIHWLIMYRLAALSSPDAFIFAEEVLQRFGSLADFKSSYVQSIFYVPSDALTKNYNTLANFIYGNIVDYEQISIFDISYYGDSRVIHYLGGTISAIFPTAEMEATQASRVVEIIDRTEMADQMLEPFWEDEKFVYYFPCIQSQSVYARLYDGREMLLVEALKAGYITPEEFESFNFKCYRGVKREENTEPDTPYFKATATYTDKKRADGIYPYANFIPDSVALARYNNDITANDVYVTDRGTYETPSFVEMRESFDGPWFESNSLILIVVESDSDILPKVSSITVDGSNVHVKLDPESLGKKQDQVYTIFIETNKLNGVETADVE